MPETMCPGPVPEGASVKEAACVHTRKIYDSCQSKDCLEDLRVYPTASSAEILTTASAIKPGGAELLYVGLDVQPMGFNRGFYTIDLRYYYKINAMAFVGSNRPVPVCGLAVFDKRSVLFGSEGSAKVFSSEEVLGPVDPLSCDLPAAVLEAVDPVILAIRLCECGEYPPCGGPVPEIPAAILQAVGESIVPDSTGGRRIYVTLGQFSILRLERDTQLLMPIYDYCIPEKECECTPCEESPCDLFSQVEFPVSEFFPPSTAETVDPLRYFRKGKTGTPQDKAK